MGTVKKAIDAISGIISLRVHKEKLKWQKSKEAKEHRQKTKDNEFYDALKDGDMKESDVIRKEKQKRINDLKKGLMIFLLISLTFVSGCITPKMSETIPPDLTPAALQTNERTYEIVKEIPIKTDEGTKVVDDDWAIVHKDILKDMNQNQTDLITSLEKTKSLSKTNYILIGAVSSLALLNLILLIVMIFVLKKKQSPPTTV